MFPLQLLNIFRSPEHGLLNTQGGAGFEKAKRCACTGLFRLLTSRFFAIGNVMGIGTTDARKSTRTNTCASTHPLRLLASPLQLARPEERAQRGARERAGRGLTCVLAFISRQGICGHAVVPTCGLNATLPSKCKILAYKRWQHGAAFCRGCLWLAGLTWLDVMIPDARRGMQIRKHVKLYGRSSLQGATASRTPSVLCIRMPLQLH